MKIKRSEEKKEKLEIKHENLKIKRGSFPKGRIPKNDHNRTKIHNKIKSTEKEIRRLNSEILEFKNENRTLQNDEKKISRIFKSKTIKTATKRFNEFKEHIDDLSESTQVFIRRLEKTFQRVTNFIIHEFLPNTNNALENYFGVTLPRIGKRKYRTKKGLERRLELSDIRYIERNVLHI